ncbi:MAG TPA: NAD(P)H-dependent oxidoreductase subunit E [Desulfobacteraceae bacterium]|nr:NAD(P)H-dependent oxidoreductase subunit E [Desulfobacteraceae bacterium]
MDIDQVDLIMKKYEYRHDALIGMMQDIQRLENYLPRETLEYFSNKLEVPLTRIYYIATFYKSFSLEPRGRHIIKVCLGTACHLNGAVQNQKQIERILHIHEGETTQDMMFSLETVNCVGTCALAPVTVVDDTYYDAVTPGKVEKILANYNKEIENANVGDN